MTRQLELDTEQLIVSKLGKEYLTYMQNTYIMRKSGLDESQAGIKIAGRNINNLRYADDTTLMAESEELKNLLMRVKEENAKNGMNSTSKILISWPLVPSPPGK